MEEESKRNQPDFNDIDAMKDEEKARNDGITDNSEPEAPIYTPDHTHFTVCKTLLEEFQRAGILDEDSARTFKEIDEENGFNTAQLEILERITRNLTRLWRIQGLVEQVKRGEIAKKIIKEELGI